jgi:hypothetical protein
MEQLTEPMMESLLVIMKMFGAKMMTKLDAYQEKIYAWLEEMKGGRKETTAWQEAMEAYAEKMETNPEEIKSVAEHHEVPNEEAEMETVGALKDRYGDRRQLKKRTQGDGGVGRRPQMDDSPYHSYTA